MSQAGREAMVCKRKEKERENIAYAKLRQSLQKHVLVSLDKQQKQVRFFPELVQDSPASQPPTTETRRIRFSEETVRDRLVSFPDVTGNEVVTRAGTHANTLPEENDQQNELAGVRTSTEVGHQRHQTVTTTNRDVVYIQNFGTVNLQTQNNHTRLIDAYRCFSPRAPCSYNLALFPFCPTYLESILLWLPESKDDSRLRFGLGGIVHCSPSMGGGKLRHGGLRFRSEYPPTALVGGILVEMGFVVTLCPTQRAYGSYGGSVFGFGTLPPDA